MLARINLVLGFTLASVFVLVVLMRVDNSMPNYQVNIGDDMTYSPAYGSFEPNSNFANGRTMQDPVAGTIARGSQLFHFAATPQDAIRAGKELSNPVDLSTEEGAASADRGAATFKTFCVSCHGGDGTGNGPVAQRGFPPPPSLLIGKSKDMKDGQLFHILTYGQNSMPQFAAQLSPALRWDVINHIRALQDAVKVEPKSESGNPEAEGEEPVAQQQSAAEPNSEPAAEPEPKTENPPESETEPAEENSSVKTDDKIVQPDSVVPAETESKP